MLRPTGGSAGGGSGGTGATAIASDDVFNDNDWDEVVQVFGAGGSGGAGQLHVNGQADAGGFDSAIGRWNGQYREWLTEMIAPSLDGNYTAPRLIENTATWAADPVPALLTVIVTWR